MFLNINGPVIANTAYASNTLVAKDVDLDLPEVVPQGVDVSAMGTMTIPVWQLLENMEASVNKIGVDQGLTRLLTPEPIDVEFRWVHPVIDANGKTTNVGCKAFLHALPNKLPGISSKVGEAGDLPCTMTVTRYQLFVDGAEMWLIDRLAGIIRIDGKDYMENIESML